ncbi:hypothetical protein MMC13_002265 [Lambiella insularis]|nr:hypothetical protein [Lambiella insularis]
MDDLAGLEWSSSSSVTAAKPLPMSNGNYFPTLRPTPPISGRSTPALQNSANPYPKPAANSNIPSNTATPSNDSFANLLPFNATSATKNLSLQEQQTLLQKRKARQQQEHEERADTHKVVWYQLSNGRATPNRIISPPTYTGTDEYGGQKLSAAINKPFASISTTTRAAPQPSVNNGDLLAAFDAETLVDSSSNFPIPSDSQSYDATLPDRSNEIKPNLHQPYSSGIDDDPFGLGTVVPKQPTASLSSPTYDDEDDVLGLLGRPVSELPPPAQISRPHPPEEISLKPVAPFDRAVAELVDMGFPADRARLALETTESGLNVQAAVGWLLNQAHEESRMKPKANDSRGRDRASEAQYASARTPSTTNVAEANAQMPAWMRQQQQGRSNSIQRREDSRSPAFGEKDPAKYAAELGNNLFKTANSLWKTGTKKINQAVTEFNSDSDSSQPKWMRDVRTDRQDTKSFQSTRRQNDSDKNASPRQSAPKSPSMKSPTSMTDEAMLLELGDARPRPRQSVQTTKPDLKTAYASDSSREQSPAVQIRQETVVQPKFMQQQPLTQLKSRLGRQAVEEEDLQAYVSPARRKKATPKPPSPDSQLLFETVQRPTRPSQPKSVPKPQPQAKAPASFLSRPAPPIRNIPPLSSIALQSSNSHRQAGTSAFKLGNYAEAASSYTLSLSALPASHPLTVVLFTNRALTHLKTGDPKACVADAESALSIIGPSKGQNESIDIGGDEGSKDMTLYWGKAMTRKAEALEQLERWSDAAQAWKDCVEAGVGGSTSIAGRNRCEKAAGGGPPSSAPAARRPQAAARKPPSKPAPRSSALDDLSGRPAPASSAPSAEAVTRLRAANAEAERVDDEKFALADAVDERLSRWRKGKEGNLRALLGSLDAVLWEGAGWRKVGMSELLVPGKVKVAYMRGIAKVHPDKLPPGATTEQMMISGAVFSALNEAWDRFKRENGL